MSGSRVMRLAALAGVLVLAFDLVIHGHPSYVFDTGFVLICVGAALAVRPRDFFAIGVLPPLLLLALMTLPALLHRAWVGQAGDGVLQAVVSGLAHRATGLLAGYLLTLAVLGIRQQVRSKRLVQLARERRQLEAQARDAAQLEAQAQANLVTSPAPTRSTTGSPSEKSTTVVGSDPHSPESMTASTQ
jgi:hypothetical protein